jgi:outer membrane lipoprotein-sorting protein
MRLIRLVSIVMLSVCALAHGQSSAKPVASSDAQKSFDLMKTLAGTWKGPITTDNPAWSTDQPMSLSIRVASSGNALIHELSTPGPEVTVFYLDNDRLTCIMHERISDEVLRSTGGSLPG